MNSNIVSNKDFNYFCYYEIINFKYKKLQILFLDNKIKDKIILNLKINSKIIFKDLNLIFDIKNYQIQNTSDKNNLIIIWEGEEII